MGAAGAPVCGAAIYKWETGKAAPGPRQLVALCAVLKLRVARVVDSAA
jgi:hypothetical protein